MPSTTVISGVQYSGIWTMQQVDSAIAAGTWPSPPAPALYSWGINQAGQLGLGNTTYYSSPKQVGSLTTWSRLATSATGNYFNLSIKTDGTLWGWGSNSNGELGLGSTTNYSSPKQVGALTNWSTIALGYNFCAAIKTDGTIWTWGRSNQGQLGIGNITSYSSPKQVGALTDWLSLSAGYYHVLATKTNGSLWSWGYGNQGQLGFGNVTKYSSPKQVGALTNWLQTAAAGYFSLAVKTDGTLWAWGIGSSGQLGQGNTASYSSPKQIGALTGWSSVAGGTSFSLAKKSNGTLWSWGLNSSGQLGLSNTSTSNYSPTQIGSLSDWGNPVCSFATAASVKTDGTLWMWGSNLYGQCGNSSVAALSSPNQVGTSTSWQSVSMTNSSTRATRLV